MKYVQVREVKTSSCSHCAHYDPASGTRRRSCEGQRQNRPATEACEGTIWIEDTPEGRNAHALLLVTKRLTQE